MISTVDIKYFTWDAINGVLYAKWIFEYTNIPDVYLWEGNCRLGPYIDIQGKREIVRFEFYRYMRPAMPDFNKDLIAKCVHYNFPFESYIVDHDSPKQYPHIKELRFYRADR